MSIGYIYILSNPAMPGLCKIGFTNREVNQRVEELSSATGVPSPFVIEYFCLTHDAEEIEKEVHKHFSSHRASGKEFFSVPIADAVKVVDSLIKAVEPIRFSKVTAHPVPTREEKPFDPQALRRWQEKRYRSNKPL